MTARWTPRGTTHITVDGAWLDAEAVRAKSRLVSEASNARAAQARAEQAARRWETAARASYPSATRWPRVAVAGQRDRMVACLRQRRPGRPGSRRTGS